MTVLASASIAAQQTSGNLDELRAAATHKSKAEIVQLLAERFPHPDVPEVLRPIAPRLITAVPVPTSGQYWPANTGAPVLGAGTLDPEPALERLSANDPAGRGLEHWPANIESPVPRPLLKPIAPERFVFQCTFDRETHDLMQEMRALLSHEIPSGEGALVINYAFKLARAELLKRKHAVTDRPRRSRGCASARRIPREVKRAVWARDGGRCTFVSESGRRCESRWKLQYDHIESVALGGQSTIENVRLLCRAHNQHAAERAFGRGFMERKRAQASSDGATR